jgi:hypothetical protein
LPDRLEMPKFFHSIWLGGPVTDGRPVTDELRRNLAKLSETGNTEGMQVILWTDVTRDEFAQPTGESAAMRDWARQHGIIVVNPDEVFHVGEPMMLAAEYRLEAARGTAAGYTKASDILRLEILDRFGGIYTDGDNEIRSAHGFRSLLRAPGFALHANGKFLNNSAMVAARHHPFIKAYLKQIATNYNSVQDHLAPQNHNVGNTRDEHRRHYLPPGPQAFRRRSILERTGPDNVASVASELHLGREQIPRIPTDQLRMGTAHTWTSTAPRRHPPEQTLKVLQHAISGLIWDLRNRQGDLNLVAVAPLIEGLPDIAAGWEAVAGYIHSVPELRQQVQTVTYSFLESTQGWRRLQQPAPLRELELPSSVLNMYGLPPRGHAHEARGTWRRAAYGVDAHPWRYLALDFESGQHCLDSATGGMRLLAQHLRGLASGNDRPEVRVWVEGGGNRRGSTAGMDRAISVQGLLAGLVGDAAITWKPTNRGTGASEAPAPAAPRQVMVWWTVNTPVATATDDADSDIFFDNVDESGAASRDVIDRSQGANTPDVGSRQSMLRRRMPAPWSFFGSRHGDVGHDSVLPLSATGHTAESLSARHSSQNYSLNLPAFTPLDLGDLTFGPSASTSSDGRRLDAADSAGLSPGRASAWGGGGWHHPEMFSGVPITRVHDRPASPRGAARWSFDANPVGLAQAVDHHEPDSDANQGALGFVPPSSSQPPDLPAERCTPSPSPSSSSSGLSYVTDDIQQGT